MIKQGDETGALIKIERVENGWIVRDSGMPEASRYVITRQWAFESSTSLSKFLLEWCHPIRPVATDNVAHEVQS